LKDYLRASCTYLIAPFSCASYLWFRHRIKERDENPLSVCMTTWHYLWLVGLLVRPTMLIIIERISICAAGKYCDARLPAHAHCTLRSRPSRNLLNPR